MKRSVGAALALVCVSIALPSVVVLRVLGRPRSDHKVPGHYPDGTLLFNGWRLTPAGRHHAMTNMPIGGAFSPDKSSYAISSCGYGEPSLRIFDVKTEKEYASLPMAHAGYALAWGPDNEKIYVAGGGSTDSDSIYTFTLDGRWALRRTYSIPPVKGTDNFISGVSVSPDDRTLYALNLNTDSLVILDVKSGAVLSTTSVGDHPVHCTLSRDGRRLYVADWGAKEVAVVDVSDPSKPFVSKRIQTGGHPTDLLLTKKGRLYVCCPNSDAVFVHDVSSGSVLEKIRTTPTSNSPSGSTPTAIALDPTERMLYVANSDNNTVCVVDTSEPGHSQVKGFIPTGWYPTAVAVTPDGRRLIAASGKGFGSTPNPGLPIAHPRATADFRYQYIGNQLGGELSFIDLPGRRQLAKYTAQAFANSPYTHPTATGTAVKSAIPTRLGDPSPIKYVLYIIKENRTYDEVFGDMGRGSSDPSLCLFGRQVSPNHHALADQFVLLDNLYANGEVSEDGHPWCDGAICTDFSQRRWTVGYSGLTPVSNPEVYPSDSLETPGAGYIWDQCRKHGVSYRSYGEDLDPYPRPGGPKMLGASGLAGHGSEEYDGIGWSPRGDLGGGNGPDNLSPAMRDTDRADVFIKEFKEFERKGTMPRFTIMGLGEDHTTATNPGTFTPQACVASNDVALGRIVETVSKSSLWKNFAIFVIEDDAQDGPDHVDSHRTVGLVISPYVRRGSLDSTMYTTVSMLRTMELCLGLPPLTQYDASATPFYNCFTEKPDLTPYKALAPRIDLTARNTKASYGATASSRMDLSHYDRADPDELNAILWHSIKGNGVPMPAPVHSYQSF